jgi:hypothetical protein
MPAANPRLTAWEEAFLVSVAESVRIARTLSVKQKAVLEKISAPLPDLAEESDGVEGFC